MVADLRALREYVATQDGERAEVIRRLDRLIGAVDPMPPGCGIAAPKPGAGVDEVWAFARALQDAYFEEKQSRKDWANEAADYRKALEELAGEARCTLRETIDPSILPSGDACRDRRPDQRDTWCYACIASDALEMSRQQPPPAPGRAKE